MTDVEKSEILHIWHVCDVESVAIYAKFMQLLQFAVLLLIHAVLSRNLFCHNLRAFMWRKIEPKSTFVEKK